MAPESAAALLADARRRLVEAGTPTPALDARLLLQNAAAITHDQLIADPEQFVDEVAARRFRACVARRAAYEPISRITGSREFYGRTFTVTRDVLDPRPDTETLIDAALPRMGRNCRVLDLGTGSGAIIITLLAESPAAVGLAVDLSPAALAVARDNAERLNVAERLSFGRSDWYAGVSGEFDLIVSNPPYIPGGDIAGLTRDVRDHDPRISLDGGADGLAAYRAIAAGALGYLAPRGLALVEIGAGQTDAVTALFAAAGLPRLAAYTDLGGHIRCLEFSPKPD